MMTVAEAVTPQPCPKYKFFVNVDGDLTFLCSHAEGTTIAADERSQVRAGIVGGKYCQLHHTGDPWDDVVIVDDSSTLVLTGVRRA